jgi:hypothetical protein
MGRTPPGVCPHADRPACGAASPRDAQPLPAGTHHFNPQPDGAIPNRKPILVRLMDKSLLVLFFRKELLFEKKKQKTFVCWRLV